jgi:hypothetical protein
VTNGFGGFPETVVTIRILKYLGVDGLKNVRFFPYFRGRTGKKQDGQQ